MKPTNIVKINPIVEISSPVLLQCKNGECGGCPNNTGKLLWIPANAVVSGYVTFNFKYNFFDASAASTSAIKYNVCSNININGSLASYSNKPDKAWATANHAFATSPSLSPSLMVGTSILSNSYSVNSTAGGWLFFRQPNPAISDVHDALCFEYNHEKRLITFRSF